MSATQNFYVCQIESFYLIVLGQKVKWIKLYSSIIIVCRSFHPSMCPSITTSACSSQWTYYSVSIPTPWAVAGPHGQLASVKYPQRMADYLLIRSCKKFLMPQVIVKPRQKLFRFFFFFCFFFFCFFFFLFLFFFFCNREKDFEFLFFQVNVIPKEGWAKCTTGGR